MTRRTHRLAVLALLAGLLTFGTAPARPARADLEKISYTDLGKLVRASKGKVVVVYFWSFG